MPMHDDTVPLRHMLDYAKEAVDMIEGKTIEDLRIGPAATDSSITKNSFLIPHRPSPPCVFARSATDIMSCA